MLLNSDIQKNIYSNDFTLSKRNKFNYVHYSKKLNLTLIIHLNKISIKYEFSKFMFLQCFK